MNSLKKHSFAILVATSFFFSSYSQADRLEKILISDSMINQNLESLKKVESIVNLIDVFTKKLMLISIDTANNQFESNQVSYSNMVSYKLATERKYEELVSLKMTKKEIKLLRKNHQKWLHLVKNDFKYFEKSKSSSSQSNTINCIILSLQYLYRANYYQSLIDELKNGGFSKV